MSDEQSDLNDAMGDAVQQAMSRVWPGDLVTRFIVIAESIDGTTSERTLVISTTPHMKSWDALGLLHYSVQKEQAAAVAENFGEA